MIHQIDTSFIDMLQPTEATQNKLKEAFKAEVYKQAALLVKDRSVKIELTKEVDVYTHTMDVLKLVADELKLNEDALKGKCRVRSLADARQIYSFILRKVSTVEVSYKAIGTLINRDHSTIMNQVIMSENLSATDKAYQQKLQKCIDVFQKKFQGNKFNNVPQY